MIRIIKPRYAAAQHIHHNVEKLLKGADYIQDREHLPRISSVVITALTSHEVSGALDKAIQNQDGWSVGRCSASRVKNRDYGYELLITIVRKNMTHVVIINC